MMLASQEILTEDSEIIKGKVYLRTGCLSGGFDYPDIGCAAITQMKAMSAKKRKSRHKAGEEIKAFRIYRQATLLFTLCTA